MDNRFKLKLSIRTKLIFMTSALLLVAFFTTGLLFYLNGKKILVERILFDLAALVDAKKDRIESLIDQDFERIELLASRIKLREYLVTIDKNDTLLEEKIKEIHVMLKEAADSVPNIDQIDILNLQGKVVSSSSLEEIGKDKSKTEDFLKGKEGKYISDPYSLNEGIKYRMAIPVRRPFRAEEVIGVIRLVVPATRMLNIVTNYLGLGQTGEVNLGKREGEDIVFLLPLRQRPGEVRFRVPMKSKIAEPMKHAIGGGSGILSGLDYRGVNVLAAYTYIPLNRWGLVVKIDLKEAFYPIEKLGMGTIAISFLVFLLSLAAIVIFSRVISQPIKKLHQGTDIVAKGELDYRVDIKSKDEFGQLAASFNHMAESLKKITASRDELNKEIARCMRTEEDLRKALKIKSDFTSMISHELRTPLTSIKEGIGIVLDESAGGINEEQKGFLNIAKRNVDRLGRLINDVLDFQKLESGKTVLDMSEYDINEVIDEMWRTLVSSAKKKGLDLVLQLDKDLPKVKFDRDKIIEVLTNLVSNAIKFTQQGSVKIITGVGDNFIQVSVQDTGVGITAEDLPKLFHEFTQLQRESKGETGGTGLGLAIAKKIIEVHKGRIWVESEFGKGTSVYFILPIKERRT